MSDAKKGVQLHATEVQVDLRFCRQDQLNDHGKATFEIAMPRFFPHPDSEAQRKIALEWLKANYPEQKGFVHDRNYRRFSGGDDLSRASYYTVCSRSPLPASLEAQRSEFGEDFGTLAAEMCAYRDPEDTDISMIVLPALRFSAAFWKHPYITASIRAELPSLIAIFVFPLSKLTKHPVFRFPTSTKENEANSAVVVLIDPLVETRRFKQAVDLRNPSTRDWFFRNFGANHPSVEDAMREAKSSGTAVFLQMNTNIRDYRGMIPDLIYPNIGGTDSGGGGVTQQIGMCLRSWGADCLIYPSARNDSVVVIKEGKRLYDIGYNLVDYTCSPRPKFKGHIHFQWGDILLPGVTIETTTELSKHGSLGILNVARANEAISKQAAPSFDPGRSGALLHMVMGTHRLQNMQTEDRASGKF